MSFACSMSHKRTITLFDPPMCFAMLNVGAAVRGCANARSRLFRELAGGTPSRPNMRCCMLGATCRKLNCFLADSVPTC